MWTELYRFLERIGLIAIGVCQWLGHGFTQ